MNQETEQRNLMVRILWGYPRFGWLVTWEPWALESI